MTLTYILKVKLIYVDKHVLWLKQRTAHSIYTKFHIALALIKILLHKKDGWPWLISSRSNCTFSIKCLSSACSEPCEHDKSRNVQQIFTRFWVSIVPLETLLLLMMDDLDPYIQGQIALYRKSLFGSSLTNLLTNFDKTLYDYGPSTDLALYWLWMTLTHIFKVKLQLMWNLGLLLLTMVIP